MRVYKAFCTFYKELLEEECQHQRVKTGKKSNYCPDCGYKVQVVWTQVRCRGCGSKRVPKKRIDGRVEPMYKYCRHCGCSEFRLIKRSGIHAHEVNYSVVQKEVDYRDDEVEVTMNPKRQKAPQGKTSTYHDNPFIRKQSCQGHYEAFRSGNFSDVVEGQVVRRYSE